LFCATQIVFGVWFHDRGGEYSPGFILFPLVAWFGFRFGPRETAAAVIILSGVCVWQTVRGLGPFVLQTSHESLLLTSAYVGAMAIMGLGIAATVTEQRQTEEELRRTRAELEFCVRDRTAELVTTSQALVGEVSERRKTEERLRRSERQLREAQQLAHVGSWEWDPASNVVRWSDELYRIYGLAPDEFGASFEAFVDRLHPDDRATTVQTVTSSLRTGRPFDFIERIIRPDGSVRTLHSRGEIVTNGDGQAVRMLGTCQDVTESREAEERLRQAERLAAIGQMAASLAHDSRNALQQIQSSVDQLRNRFGVGGESALVDEIQEAYQRLRHLLEDVRGYAAPLNLDRRMVNLAAVWREAWSRLAQYRRGRVARLEEHPHNLNLSCLADPICLERVFHNILLNSLAACGDPTLINIQCSHTSLNGQSALRVLIRDNGPGLNREQKEKIFQPFFTTKSEGTGLGMSISKRIIEAHGGRIQVDSKPGCGADVVIILPTARS
jgi:PAS domain S-box-containing protein